MHWLHNKVVNLKARLFQNLKPVSNSTYRIVEGLKEALIYGAFFVGLAAYSATFAGTDATFSAATTIITNWTTGSLGKLMAVAGLASAVVGLVFKFDWRLIATALGIGLTAAVGPGIVSALVTAVF